MTTDSNKRKLKAIADQVKEDIELLLSVDSSFEPYKEALFGVLFTHYLKQGI